MAINLTPWGERRSGRTRADKRRTDWRPEDDRDRSRVIHCAAFRRLQGKTQVLGIGEGDFHRTRLTHSMEVAQIGRGIVYQLGVRYRYHQCEGASIPEALPSIAQIETIGFAHDLGHPPFGHRGEAALNYMMRRAGGFEGNGQTLRILTKLETHTPDHGLDVTRRTLLGTLKYPAPSTRVTKLTPPPEVKEHSKLVAAQCKPPKCYLDTEEEAVEWILKPLSAADREQFTAIQSPTPTEHGTTLCKALDTTIMDLADEIAYGIHDLEDSIFLNLVSRDHWEEAIGELDEVWARQMDLDPFDLTRQVFEHEGPHGTRKIAVGALINAMVSSVEIHPRIDFECPLIAYEARLSDPARHFLAQLRSLVRTHVINTQGVQTLEYRGQQIILSLFEALASDPQSLLGEHYPRHVENTEHLQRSVCDYVAGMTDSYATRIYERLFVPRQGSVFERL